MVRFNVNWLKKIVGTSTQLKSEKRAAEFVDAARLFAVTSYKPVLDRFPEVRVFSSRLEQWDFFMTVATMSSGVGALATQLPREEFTACMRRIQREMDGWDRPGFAALDDCMSFVNRSFEEPSVDEHAAEDALGLWFLWNMLGRAPEYEETRPARAIGTLASRFGRDYWS
jgi:hypothetical protein